MTTAKVLIWIIRIVEGFLGYLGLFLYRTFKLPSLPWIGAYFLANWVPKILMPIIMAIFFNTKMFREDVINASTQLTKDELPKVQALIGMADWFAIVGKISYLLLTLLVISEIIHLVGSKTTVKIPTMLTLTLTIRNNVRLVGTLIVIITLFAHFFSTAALYNMLF